MRDPLARPLAKRSESDPQLQVLPAAAGELSKLLQLLQIDSTLESELGRSLIWQEFRLGDELFNSQDQSAPDTEQSARDAFYILQEGRVRLLAQDEAQREVSIGALEAGQVFGCDRRFCRSPLNYRVVAASTGKIVQIPLSRLAHWFSKVPELRSDWVQQAKHREQSIFFKTRTTLCTPEANLPASRRSHPKHQKITSYQLQEILPYLQELTIPVGSLMATTAEGGYCWLRQGEIDGLEPESEPHRSGWNSQLTPAPWRAKTEVRIYQLPEAAWDQAIAIAPPLDRLLFPDRATDNSSALSVRMDISPQRGRRQPQGQMVLAAPNRGEAPEQSDGNAAAVYAPAEAVIEFPKPQKSRGWHKPWQGYPYIQQQSSSDCGVTCLAMIGQYWGKRFNLNSLRNLAKVGRAGAGLKNLAAAAEAVGFQARPVRASLSRMSENRPWIAHWQGDHYVVVYRVYKNKLLVADPARGKRMMPRSEFLASWSEYGLLLDPTPKLQSIQSEAKGRRLSQFSSLLWSYQSVLWQVVLISLLIQVFGLITPLFTQVILDRVVAERSLVTLNVFAIGLLLFSVARVGLVATRQYLLDYFGNRLDLTLVSGFVSHALKLPLKFFEARQVGDVITRVQENQKIQMFLVRQAVSTWLDALMAVVYLGLMFYYNWRLALLVVGLLPPIILLALGATPLLRRMSREVFSETAEQNSQLVEMMTGVTTIKTMASEREMRWRWEDRLTSMLNTQFRGRKLANNLQAASGLINAIGSAVLLWYGAMLVIQGSLTIGQFVAFNMLIGNVINPVLALVGFWDEFQEVTISVERLNDVFEAEPEEDIHRSMMVMPPIQGEVQFENMTFRYDNVEDQNVLQNISFSVPAGQTVAIVGRSGSGKSTLVKLLQGLYHPTNGRIWIDGHDVSNVSPPSLRSQLGVVPQECFLFSGTIFDNIQLYRHDYGLEEVVEVAKLAEAHGFIQDLPLGYNTKVGERGSNLSGGQRQRIAIARALLGRPAILLLDEATSSLDTESERRFQQNLMRISRGRTTFIIAHRLSTVRHADLILVIDKGILVEQGNHEELIARKQLYYHLAQQQLDLS